MDSVETEYSFLWFIENCSYSQYFDLVSPEFTPQGLEGTSWVLRLNTFSLRHNVNSIYLRRSANDVGPEKISLKLEISISKVDGSALYSERCEHAFGKGGERAYKPYMNMEELYAKKNTDFLPRDTLVVRCKMWKGEGIVRSVVQCSARTRIGIENISYIHKVENFSALKPGEENTLQIPSHSKTGCDFSSRLFIDVFDSTEMVFIENEPSRGNYRVSKKIVSVIDRSLNIIEYGEVDYRFDDISEQCKKMCQRLSRQLILNNREEYLPNDELSLLCEYTFTTGPEHSTVETVPNILNSSYNPRYYNQLGNNEALAKENFSFRPCASSDTTVNCNKETQTSPLATNFVPTNQMINNDLYNDKYNNAEKLSTGPSMQDDFKALYNDQLLTDVVLKTATESFPAHKHVLCARSAVFRDVLTNDMKEKITDCIRVDDLEDETVQRLLLFLYSDNLENLRWESALKLYYAGDKYAIEKVKALCSSFLVDSITISTASELLLLADTHSDTNLKKFVEDFILEHDEEVFCSDEWEKLSDTNPQLGMKTMQLMYKRKKEGK